MQIIGVGLDGDVENFVSIMLDANSLRAVPLLSPVVPVERDVFPYRLYCQMLTEVRHVFTHEAYLLTQNSRFDRVFGNYSDAGALFVPGLKVYIDTYPSAPHFITTGARAW